MLYLILPYWGSVREQIVSLISTTSLSSKIIIIITIIIIIIIIIIIEKQIAATAVQTQIYSREILNPSG